MAHTGIGSWETLLLLGAFHGINPGMGWLFAVALGMQENRSSAVWAALVPLAVGHALAIALAVVVGIAAGTVMPVSTLRWPIAGILIALGIRRLVRHRHPRWGSMRIGAAGLMIWSFLVATAHGAGMMVLPVWLSAAATTEAASNAHFHGTAPFTSGLAATAVHSGSYLIVTAAIAWLVFTWVGVGVLRKAWINLDLIWAAALIASGGFTILMSSTHPM